MYTNMYTEKLINLLKKGAIDSLDSNCIIKVFLFFFYVLYEQRLRYQVRIWKFFLRGNATPEAQKWYLTLTIYYSEIINLSKNFYKDFLIWTFKNKKFFFLIFII